MFPICVKPGLTAIQGSSLPIPDPQGKGILSNVVYPHLGPALWPTPRFPTRQSLANGPIWPLSPRRAVAVDGKIGGRLVVPSSKICVARGVVCTLVGFANKRRDAKTWTIKRQKYYSNYISNLGSLAVLSPTMLIGQVVVKRYLNSRESTRLTLFQSNASKRRWKGIW